MHSDDSPPGVNPMTQNASPLRFEIQMGSWREQEKGAHEVRTLVFLQEQAIPVELEWDDEDHSAVHAVAQNAAGQAIGTGRLLPASPTHAGAARIGRMAVLPAYRGLGVGAALLDHLLDQARKRGDHTVILHAQCHAQAFYARAGFQPQGTPFDEAGIAHIEMVKHLIHPQTQTP
jgi:predicted GNAT family N-acyltransferase